MAFESPSVRDKGIESAPQLQAVATFPSPMDAPQIVPMVYCKLCLNEHPSEATSQLHTCKCVFCTACLQQYVNISIADGGGATITCPDVACLKIGELLDSEIASLATADQVEMHQRLRFERGVQLDPSKAWCPGLRCQAVCSVAHSTVSLPSAVCCLACHTVFCSACRGPWHHTHTCAQSRPIVLPSPSSDSRGGCTNDIKQCPMCWIYIERNQGCAQMICKLCKHTFCWHCLQSLEGDIFLRHYDKGSCKNKLGHSRASVMWNRVQVVGVLVGVSIIVMVASPLLLLASPCILCCGCNHLRGKKKKKTDVSKPES